MSRRPILDGPRLLELAQRETGLSDFGDETLPGRFQTAIDHIGSLGLGEAGEQEAARISLGLLTYRLRFFEDFKLHPIGEETIERPVFATGEGRSGTTLLHALLSVDPNGRALRFWEVMRPSPPPGLSGPDDPRRRLADEDWRDINTRMPGWLVSHPYNDMLGEGLPEDERTWAFDFRVLTPTAWWRVPMPQKSAGLPSDPAAQYRIHKMMLQQFQYRRPRKYWVLKGFHQTRIKWLFEAYPDARLIWVHRDPIQVLASRIVLSGEITEMLTGHVDWDAKAREMREMAIGSYLHALDDPMLDDPRIHHVRYPDLVADPVGTLRRFYEAGGMAFGPETEQAMCDYLARNRSDRYGKFRYSTDVIRADIGPINAQLTPYRERFGLELEKR